jgi:two-component system NarL family response regulator
MKVLLVDDHRLLVEGLTDLLTLNGIQVIGTAHDGLEAVAQARALMPDLILMDIAMPRSNGLDATRRIKAQQPEIRIVMLTTSAEDRDLFEAIKSGACGYLLKSSSGKDLIEALQGLEEGVPPFSPGLAAKILGEFARQPDGGQPAARHAVASAPERATRAELTARQTQVLQLVAEGLTYKEVGARLGLSERTVRYHMAEIMDQLHLEHRSQVIAYAGRMGFEKA